MNRPFVGYLGIGPIPIEQAIVRIERPHMDRSLNERTNSRVEWCNTALGAMLVGRTER
jgi:hypothetical protein